MRLVPPLHPLLLQGWLTMAGATDVAGRLFSAICGVATIGVVFLLARSGFDRPTGFWAAWLSALSPLLIYYSRETRMYAWLVLIALHRLGLSLSRCEIASPSERRAATHLHSSR